jgi:hypothetical protein
MREDSTRKIAITHMSVRITRPPTIWLREKRISNYIDRKILASKAITQPTMSKIPSTFAPTARLRESFATS